LLTVHECNTILELILWNLILIYELFSDSSFKYEDLTCSPLLNNRVLSVVIFCQVTH